MNPTDPMAHQASPPLFKGASPPTFSPYQSATQMPQNAMMGNHGKIPGLASLDEEQRSGSITQFVNQALERRAHYPGQMRPQTMTHESQPLTTIHPMQPRSATHFTPSQDPRPLQNEPNVRSLKDRIAEFEYDIQSQNTRPRPATNAFIDRHPVGGPSADNSHPIHGDARPANLVTGNDEHQQYEQSPPVAGTKRSRSPENHDDSGSDSAAGMMSRPKRHQTRAQAARRRLNGTPYQPTHGASSPQAESEDGDSLFVSAQPRHLKAESSASPESDAPSKTSSARELKQRLVGKSVKAFSRKMNPEKDPENVAIKRMRCVERKQFDDIADILNKARVAGGLEPTFTANAVYGRFQRIAPRIAALEGQPDFNYRDYLHIPREAMVVADKSAPVSLPPMTPRQETLFVEAYERVRKDVWVYTAARFREMGGFELSPEQAALKFKSI